MPLIHLTTFINAPADRVFDLSRNIDLHKTSLKNHQKEAVAGTRFGMIEKDETVTWKARLFFKTRILKMRVTEMLKSSRFTGEQAEGGFKELKHEHHFKPCQNGTIMIDLFHFEAPYGVVGKCLSIVYLTSYIKKLLEHRNKTIKEFAESNKWRMFLEK